MTETVIMTAVLGFAWILCYFSLFMAGNGIRNMSAVRHMAWMKGNDLDAGAQAGTVDSAFFAFNDFMTNGIREGTVSTGALSAGGGTALGTILGWGMPDLWHVETGFGITGMSDAKASRYPFIFMNTKFPFMPTSLLEQWLMMKGTCEWEPVHENWEGFFDMISSMFG